MRELVEYIARALVDSPEEVQVDEVGDDRSVVYELHVREEDRGKVIGRNGRMARAIRTLVSAGASLDDRRATVEILD